MNRKEKFQSLKTPNDLMDFLDTEIEYGWIGIDNKIRRNSLDGFYNNYKFASLDESLEYGVGICFEQVLIEKKYFEERNIPCKTFTIMAPHMAHAFLYFSLGDNVYKFEHSSFKRKGIYPYESESELLEEELTSFLESHNIKNKNRVEMYEYDELLPGMKAFEIREYLKETKPDLIPKYSKDEVKHYK